MVEAGIVPAPMHFPLNVYAPSRFMRYLTVILRWLLIMVAVFVLTFLGGKYITDNVLFQVPAASATIQVPPSDLMPPAGEAKTDPVAFQPKFETIIRSPDFLLPVIVDLDLDKVWAKRVFNSDEEQLLPQEALENMNKILKLDFVSETNVVTITASSDVPKEAADIANAIADRYKAMRDFEEDRGKNRGEDSIADRQPQEGPVLILSRAQTPPVPDKFFAYLVTILAAGLLSVMAASFVEMIFLFLRAAERTDN